MKLSDLKVLVDKYIDEGYSDVDVHVDTEARIFDCHIVPAKSLNVIPEEAMGEKYVIIYLQY